VGAYLYGVIQSPAPPSFDVRGFEDADVRTISEGHVAAVVSKCDFENARGSRRNLMAHTRVLETIYEERTVLPVGFGTIFRSENDIRNEVLGPQQETLLEMLSSLEGMTELTLKGFYQEDALLREVLESSPGVREAKRNLNVAGSNAYLANVQLGERVVAEISRLRERDASEILEALESLASKVKISPPDADTMAFNTAFLVHRSQLEAFDEAVRKIGERFSERMRLRYVGPLPAYDFVYLPIKPQSDQTWAS
jgi:Gas vesicle synthesis protein GvpL/GvpF